MKIQVAFLSQTGNSANASQPKVAIMFIINLRTYTHTLTTVELPDDPAVATEVLRRLEATFIESALAREQPLQNKNEPLCKCERTRKYQREWRARNPNYMKIKGGEWRARRKAQREAIEQQRAGNQ
eukprot:COSAG02_NODE_13383_length_1401_cov_1.602151_2_plen_126_part_00